MDFKKMLKLVRLHYSDSEIGERVYLDRSTVWRLRTGALTRIAHDKAENIKALYDGCKRRKPPTKA